jgi:hypothetical protein
VTGNYARRLHPGWIDSSNAGGIRKNEAARIYAEWMKLFTVDSAAVQPSGGTLAWSVGVREVPLAAPKMGRYILGIARRWI